MTWRLLFVDDTEEDVELAKFALGELPAPWTRRRVATRDDLIAALRDYDPHLVLCDLNLPGFCCEEARQIVFAATPAPQFAILTGAVEQAEHLAEFPIWDKNRLDQLPGNVSELLMPSLATVAVTA
ncbi:CheY-like chemotaxis protein [Lysobacter enzymogenes]|uniref:response regulator n=1 Tax=Lysobacter enzymogenes TaxID=69 RepID=UPI003391C3B6